MELREQFEVAKGEGLKTAAEYTLHLLGKTALGEKAIERWAFELSDRVEDPALLTTLAGIEFENPIMVGAGWDKKGWAVRGLYQLGFSGVEVGTVPLFPQPGNKKPRMETVGQRHGVGHNSLGFNAKGVEVVKTNLDDQQPFPCPVGINVGKNKLVAASFSPWAHAEVVMRLYPYASYFVFNPSSPNTERLRELQAREAVKAHVGAMQEAMIESGGLKPLFIKLAPDLTRSEFYEVIDTAVEEQATGLVLVNTTNSGRIKSKYGLDHKSGGLSGNDWEYRAIASQMVAEAYERAGDKLEIIGVGGISEPEHAIERMLAGASITQSVTGIREHWGRNAARINRGILKWMEHGEINNIQEIIGGATKRGPKYPKAD